MRAIAVIGANWGDEGKGLVTDYLASQFGDHALVVRANGGAQAGHTVQLQDGTRHVFSHFGAGTLAGCDTYLSRFFVCNPILFLEEEKKLASLPRTARRALVFADDQAPVTTPWDMMLNQAAERARGDGRHGSCGVGFNETLTRHEEYDFRLNVGHLRAPRADLQRRLHDIATKWTLRRAMQLEHQIGRSIALDHEQMRYFEPLFFDQCREFAASIQVNPMEPWRAFRGRADVIFEGAQGLALDMDTGAFPHVTRSHTGLRNVFTICQMAGGFDKLEAIYLTRTYFTRHGAGPLPGELAAPPFAGIVDETNKPHAFQGTLRFAPLDTLGLAWRIHDDIRNWGRGFTASLAVTCCDQAGGAVDPEHIASEVRLPLRLTSFGPTRFHVEQWR